MNNSSYMEFGYVGSLAEQISEFIRHKRMLGFKYATEARYLFVLSKLSLAYDLSTEKLPEALVSDWIARKPNETEKTRDNRIVLLRQFALYLAERGYRVNIPKVVTGTKTRSSFTPYIYTHEEIATIFKNSDRLNLRYHATSNTQITFPVIIRMLYGCGLRISEALNLRVKDVDLDRGILTLRETKGGQERLIPMSDSLHAICKDYSSKMHQFSGQEEYFFAHKDGSPFNASTVYKRFRRVLWASGISHGGKDHGPRLHDVRHAFSVHSLKMQADKGIDLYCALPVLSTYLGHKSVKATDGYVRLTEEMYPELIKKMSAASGHVIPRTSR